MSATEVAARLWRRFWFEFRVPAAKLNLLRVTFFGVLAVDQFTNLAHAPRYGAGGFNVSQLPFLDGILPVPSRVAIGVLFVLQAYLALRVMMGVAIKGSVRLLAGLYAYTYFISQLDSYQHHYLVFLLLVVACTIPWDEAAHPTGEAPANDEPRTIASWGLRLLTVQLALLYLWAAISKMSPLWLDGTALSQQLGVPWVRHAIEVVFGSASRGDPGGFAAMAKLIMIAELVLAVGVLIRWMWPAVWLIGMGFHISVELSGYRIGLFSYFMMGLYVLFLPDVVIATGARAWHWLTDPTAGVLRRAGEATRELAWPLLVVAMGAGAALVAVIPFEARWLTVGVISLAGLVAGIAGGRRRAHAVAMVHVLACALLLVMQLVDNQTFDYYKFLSGTSRRLGDEKTAKYAYQRLTEVSPDYGPAYYHLGDYARAAGKQDQALDLYRSAEMRDPPDPRPFRAAAAIYRAQGNEADAMSTLKDCQQRVTSSGDCFVAEAQMHRMAGRRAEAAAAAKKALQIDPRDRAARALLQWARGGGK